MPINRIKTADLRWNNQGLPRSAAFDDVYFSAADGLEESRYVFLRGNNLEQRWSDMDENSSFVIAETGFGSGLNLLAAAQLWQRSAPASAQLHFISTELYPMRLKDLQRTLEHWPELAPLTQTLINCYPAITPGFHRFDLTDNISVTLIFDDIASALSALCPSLATELWNYQNWQVDAWFLDGFAPSQNPDMWTDRVFSLINRLSTKNTTAATFTCAGSAKQGLKKWGFDIQKIPGFGRKREMLIAERNMQIKPDLETQQQGYRAVKPCWHLDEHKPSKPSHIAIIGAGIAGCTLAEALKRKAIDCTLIDANSIGSGASGNPQAALYTRLSPDQGDLEDFCLHALNYARGYYQNRLEDANHGDLCGLIQLPKSAAEHRRMTLLAQRFADAPELLSFEQAESLSSKAQIAIQSDGLWFPNSGWINGPAFCQKLAEDSGAKLIEGQQITDIREQNGLFTLITEQQEIGQFDAVVICTAMQTKDYQAANWLPIKPIRGQISFLHNQPETNSLKTVVCKNTYLTPVYKGKQSIGAPYELNVDSSELKPLDHQKNLQALQKLLDSEKALDMDISKLSGWASTRCTTPDYLPIVGSLPLVSAFNARFAGLSKDRKRAIPIPAPNSKGIYLNLGYGSRGYSYAPLCAELLAAKIAGQPEPVSTDILRSLHPARFLARGLARNQPIV